MHSQKWQPLDVRKPHPLDEAIAVVEAIREFISEASHPVAQSPQKLIGEVSLGNHYSIAKLEFVIRRKIFVDLPTDVGVLLWWDGDGLFFAIGIGDNSNNWNRLPSDAIVDTD